MNTWPAGLGREPGHSFVEDFDKSGTKVASATSGLSVVNELFTFVPMFWKGVFNLTNQADKETIMAFYLANRGVAFKWLNTQDSNTYEVIFLAPPKRKLDKISTRWRVTFTFKQYSTVIT